METDYSTPAPYEKPQIADYGDLVELTAAGADGDQLDADFNAVTKRGDLTFSNS